MSTASGAARIIHTRNNAQESGGEEFYFCLPPDGRESIRDLQGLYLKNSRGQLVAVDCRVDDVGICVFKGLTALTIGELCSGVIEYLNETLGISLEYDSRPSPEGSVWFIYGYGRGGATYEALMREDPAFPLPYLT